MLATQIKKKFGNNLILLINSLIHGALKHALYYFRLGGERLKKFAFFFFLNQFFKQHL